MNNITCLECGAVIEVESSVIIGEIIECPDCGVELEVVSVNPVTVAPAPEVEEDWGE